MSELTTAASPARSEACDPARVLRAVSQAPQFSWQRGWHIVRDGEAWLILGSDDDLGRLTQAQLVSAGSAAQLLLLAREAQGRASSVVLLPREDPHCIVALHDAGPAPSGRAEQLLQPSTAVPGRTLAPSDVRHLNLTAEAFGCELLWQDGSTPRAQTPGLRRVSATADRRPLTTLISRGDVGRDWLQAGRAAAQCSLVAKRLGLALGFGVHPFSSWASREEIHQLWKLSGWPQLQFTIQEIPAET